MSRKTTFPFGINAACIAGTPESPATLKSPGVSCLGAGSGLPTLSKKWLVFIKGSEVCSVSFSRASLRIIVNSGSTLHRCGQPFSGRQCAGEDPHHPLQLQQDPNLLFESHLAPPNCSPHLPSFIVNGLLAALGNGLKCRFLWTLSKSCTSNSQKPWAVQI